MHFGEFRQDAPVFHGVFRREDGEAVREDFQVQGKGGSQVSVHVGDDGFIFRNGKMSLSERDYGEEVRAHLHAGEEFRCRFEGPEPFEIMHEAEFDEPFIPLFRREEIVETAGGVGEHGGDEGR